MICAIQQPTLFPWLGYFAMIAGVDRFIFLDSVQLVKRSWMVRNKIKTEKGILYLTIPIKKTHSRNETYVSEASIDYSQDFIDKHLKSIHFAYGKTPFYDEIFPLVRNCYSVKNRTIADFNISFIQKICNKIKINTPFLRSSALKKVTGKKDGLLVSICKEIGARKYLSAYGSAAYIETNNPGGAFSRNDIELFYHKYEHPIYPQQFGDYISHVCVLDLLFNTGFEKSREIIFSGIRKPVKYKDFGLPIIN